MAHALDKKWRLTRQSKSRLADLDNMVQQRTVELRRRAEMENIVSTLSTQFIGLSPGQVEEAILGALKVIGAFAGVDHGLSLASPTAGSGAINPWNGMPRESSRSFASSTPLFRSHPGG